MKCLIQATDPFEYHDVPVSLEEARALVGEFDAAKEPIESATAINPPLTC